MQPLCRITTLKRSSVLSCRNILHVCLQDARVQKSGWPTLRWTARFKTKKCDVGITDTESYLQMEHRLENNKKRNGTLPVPRTFSYVFVLKQWAVQCDARIHFNPTKVTVIFHDLFSLRTWRLHYCRLSETKHIFCFYNNYWVWSTNTWIEDKKQLITLLQTNWFMRQKQTWLWRFISKTK